MAVEQCTLLSRADALATGRTRYFTGLPCVRGHISERTTSSTQCVQCVRESKRAEAAAKKAARDPLPSELSGASRREAIAAGKSTYIGGTACPRGHFERYITSYSCVECMRRVDLTERKRQYDVEYRARPDVVKRLEQQKTVWRAANAGLIRAVKSSYKARRKVKEKAGDSSAEIADWLKAQPRVCHWCNAKCRKDYHIDHYEPLSKGGKHEVKNLVIACPSCNLRKNAKDPYEFAKERGRLF
jgi:5-methylcytosine-specific restriction endonuclease McrA